MCSLVVGDFPQKMQSFEARAMTKSSEPNLDDESKLRFEAALKGARVAGPKPMKSMTPKGVTAQSKEAPNGQGNFMDRILVTETATGLLAIKSADTVALSNRVDAAVNAFLAEAAVSDEAAARRELAAAFGYICPNSKLSIGIRSRILHP
jgi:hypothetical protein